MKIQYCCCYNIYWKCKLLEQGTIEP